MKADFSKGFRIESEDGRSGTTRIYDSTGGLLGMLQHFELILDAGEDYPRIVLEFFPGSETMKERAESLEGLYLPGKKTVAT